MGAALVPLQNIALGSAQASVTFGSIPSTFRDLRIVFGSVTNSTNSNMSIRFNGDTGANYYYANMVGDGSSATFDASSGGDTMGYVLFMNPSGTITGGVTDIFDYSATDKHKSILTDRSHSQSRVVKTAQRWASTSAITSILLFPGSGSFQAGSSFALYGVVS